MESVQKQSGEKPLREQARPSVPSHSGPDWRLYAALERRFARIPCLLPARGQTPGLPSHGPSQLCPGDGGSLQNQGETTPQA